MLEVFLTWVFWKTLLMVLAVGSPILALGLYGINDSRKRVNKFRKNLHSGYYAEMAAERRDLTRVG